MLLMSKQGDLNIIVASAEKYKKELLGRNLLFLSLDKHKDIHTLEVSFGASHFLHLTGVTTDASHLSAKTFFDRCLEHRLRTQDFEYKNDGWTPSKLRALQSIISKNLNAVMIGDYNQTKPLLITEKIVGGEYNALGFVMSDKSKCYVPNTALECDIRQITHAPSLQIVLTCRKYQHEKEYAEVVYSTKSDVNWDKIKKKLLDLDERKDIIALIDKTLAYRSGHLLQHDKTQNEERQNSDNMTTDEIKKQIADYEAQKSVYVKKCTERLPQSLKNGYAMKAQEDFDKQHAEEAKEVAALKKILEEREPKRPKQNEGKDRGGR